MEKHEVSTFSILKDLSEVAEELKERGHYVTFFIHDVPEDSTPAVMSEDITVFHPPKPAAFPGFFSRFKKLVSPSLSVEGKSDTKPN